MPMVAFKPMISDCEDSKSSATVIAGPKNGFPGTVVRVCNVLTDDSQQMYTNNDSHGVRDSTVGIRC